jgi:hypothetical protein
MTLRLTDSRSVSLGVEPTLWTFDQILLPFQVFGFKICCLVSVGRPLWREANITLRMFKKNIVYLRGNTAEGHCHHYASQSVIITMVSSYVERLPVARIRMTSLGTTLTQYTLTGDWVYSRGNIPLRTSCNYTSLLHPPQHYSRKTIVCTTPNYNPW